MKKLPGKIFVLIKIFKGIHDGVELFWNENEAERAYRRYTGYDYPEDEESFENINADFADCRIFEVNIPPVPEARSCTKTARR